MKKFEELKVNDIIKTNNYILKVVRYNDQLNAYHLEVKNGKDKNNDIYK